MPTNQPNYLRRDLIILGVLVVIITAVLGGLWYAEQRSGTFSALARTLLDSRK